MTQAEAEKEAAAAAEKERIMNISENLVFWPLRRKERQLWKPIWRAYKRGEKVSKEDLDYLVKCVDALMKVAKARARELLELMSGGEA